MKLRQDIEPISKQLTIIVGLTVVGFMAFGLALSFYRNILFEQTLDQLSVQNNQIAKDIEKGYQNLDYFASTQYKDKYAKENLRKIDPGEKVLMITELPPPIVATPEMNAQETERKDAAYEELLRQMPVLDQWKLYLFNRDKVEELKKGL